MFKNNTRQAGKALREENSDSTSNLIFPSEILSLGIPDSLSLIPTCSLLRLCVRSQVLDVTVRNGGGEGGGRGNRGGGPISKINVIVLHS